MFSPEIQPDNEVIYHITILVSGQPELQVERRTIVAFMTFNDRKLFYLKMYTYESRE